MNLRRFSSALLSASLLAGAAHAQTPPSPSVRTLNDPAQVEKRFDEIPVPTSEKPVSPSLPKSKAGVPSGVESKRFVLKGVAIDGSTVYKQEDFTPLFADMLGKEISAQEAATIADRVTTKYRTDGYILSQAVLPKQDFKNGVVQVRAVEGFINEVTVEGDVRENSWRHLIQSYGEKIKREKPLNIRTLERYLLLMDDLPGATAKGVVKPSESTFGAADLVVTVEHKLLDGSLTTDNRGTKFIGPQQYSAALSANSAAKLYERTTLRFITTSPTSELRFYDFQQEHQVGTEGTRVLVGASHSRTEPSHTLTPLDIHADSNSYQAKVSHPFIRSRAENLSGRVAFDYRSTDTDLLGGKFTNDRLRVLRGGASYDFGDRFDGANLIDLQVSKGLNIFNPSSQGTSRSRADGDSDFTKINADISRTQTLPRNFSLFAALSGQYSANKLLSSEQFTVGGASFGGAYDPAELSGDHGVGAKAELRYGRALGLKYFEAVQGYGYYDIGKVWDKVNTGQNTSLASTGLGVRAYFVPWLSGSAEMAFPLTKQVSVERDKDPRFFFSVTGRF